MAGAAKKLGLTGKIFSAYLIAAIVPLALASAIYLILFFRLGTSVTIQVLTEKTLTAKLLLEAKRDELARRLASIARENMVTVNVELGLAQAVSGYLTEVAASNGMDGIEVRDAGSGVFASAPFPGRTPFPAAETAAAPRIAAETALASGSGKPLGTIAAYISLGSACRAVAASISTPVLILSGSGEVLAFSAPPGAEGPFAVPAGWKPRLSGQLSDPASLRSGAVRYTLNFAPLEISPGQKAWIGAAYSMERLAGVLTAGFLLFALVLVGNLLLSMAASAYFSRTVTRPLRKLASAARKISLGGFGAVTGIRQGDEVGELARDFDAMSAALARQLGELERTRGFLDDFVNSIPSALAAVDEGQRVTHWNEAAEAISGVAADKALGQEVCAVLPYLAPFRPLVSRAIDSLEPQAFPRIRLEAERPEKGKAVFLDASVFPMRHGEGRGAVLRLDDATEMERKETELRQAQKMDMLGNLTSGIAHDFNNLLMGIMGTASLLSLKLSEEGPADKADILEDVKAVRTISERARDLVRQISGLSRRQELSLKDVDLKAAVASVATICANSLDKSIRIDSRFPEEEAWVHADSVLVEQVVLNLCVNAAHAMTIMRPPGEKRGGTLELSLERIAADEHFCASHSLARKGPYWALRIADSGVGIDAEGLQKIFDPFYTTKAQGQGSGLGLSTAYGIVMQHKGFIDVYSTPGLGSTFTVYLPALRRGAGAAAGDETEGDILRGSGTVMVLDDEAAVLRVTKGLLEACGYRAVLASTADEARARLAGGEPGVDALILDMSMPGISGDEAFRIVRAADPGLKVLIASGYRNDPRIDAVLAEGAAGFLQKPYSVQELSLKLGALLRKA
jgi:PAS domain S-box-containing protein